MTPGDDPGASKGWRSDGPRGRGLEGGRLQRRSAPIEIHGASW